MEIALSMTKSSMDFHNIPRMVVNAVTDLVEQVTHYYPYGGVIGGIDHNPGFQKYKYGGKELDRSYGLDWYDVQARQYDPVVPSWHTIDPLAEKYYWISPYAYCAGNPVNAVDQNGMDWYRSNSTLYYTWFNGNNNIEGYTYIGEKGSVLGGFETIIDNILCGDEGLGLESMYSEGFTFDIAPSDKGALIGSRERGWDFLDESLCDAGPEFSVLLGNHPYTQEMKNDSRVLWSQNKIRTGDTKIAGRIVNVGKEWGLVDLLTSDSFVKQFIGSYRYDGYVSKDGGYIYNVISDSKSRTSLFYHSGLNNPRRNTGKPLGNTYQFYIWKSPK